ncbi:unnamed protein product [Owenia fusiformis]|uniref:Uncharacterized protein n=1 Tax=Owenia fusiformis TaxID=6347 RepID=A0A8J1T7C9_OWEFU|nr:unnamed protein product [Owenia fusiformis]
MEIWVAKVIILGALFLLTLSIGLLPITFIKRLQSGGHKFSISCLNCFAGGIFLGTTLLHLLPEAREHLIDSLKNDLNIDTEFPVSEFLVCLGFFLVLIVEGTALACGGATIIHVHDTHREEDHGHVEEIQIDLRNSKPIGKRDTAHLEKQRSESDPILKAETAFPNYTGIGGRNNKRSERVIDQTAAATAEGCRKYPKETLHDSCSDADCEISNYTEAHCHIDTNLQYREQRVKYIAAFVLLLALSFHSIFEGIALGLQESNAQIWLLFVSLAVHKAFIAFGMGSTFVETFAKIRTTVIFMCIFAIVTPIGIVAGILITIYGGDNGNNVATGVLQTIATGTFLYVTFFEVLGHEIGDHSKFSRPKDLLKLLATIIGFCCAATLQFIPDVD